MRAGQLRHRVTIQEPVEGAANDFNEAAVTWSDVCKVWARILPKTAKEVSRNERISMDATHLLTIRYRNGIESNMRIVFGSRTFNIDSVINTDERGTELQLVCMEVV